MKINYIRISLPRATNGEGTNSGVTIKKQIESSYRGSSCYDLIHILHTLSKSKGDHPDTLFDSNMFPLFDAEGNSLLTK